MQRIPFFALFLALSLGLAACGDAPDTAEADMADDAEMADDAMDDAMAAGPTIVALTEEAGLNTLRDAVVQAGLVETLSGPGPFTVFAPSDAAFGALDDETLNTLMMDENQGQLAGILTYHVLPQEVMSSGLSGTVEVETVNGAMLTVTAGEDGTVTVTDAGGNTATVTDADVEASNGVVHVIDAVLMPPADDTM